jgi:NAD(P)-dependent dehydrogenase (short-subunit alcohol dehydrogenase family)
VRAAAGEVRAHLAGRTLAGLVNNAGMGTGGPLAHQPVDEIRGVFEVNVFGAVTVSQAFIPLLGADRALTGAPGRIVNITSVAGKFAPPFLGDYAMSKHALEAFTEALRRELMIYGIDVIAIGPGAVVTPIWDKAERGDETAYAKTDYAAALKNFKEFFIADGRKGFPPERIGEAIFLALTVAKPRVRYAVVPRRLVNWTIPNLLPKRVIDRLLAKRIGLTRRA